jgi:alkanesulfonate monooxygenase SsuD/methylene tetrahydromethanopterin reductase-like flavin-dependent oxidoreductase (luciferase family)
MAVAISLALSGEQLIDLVDEPQLAERIGHAPVAFFLAGTDRIVGEQAPGATLEPTLAATLLAQRVPQVGWLIGAAAHTDHPYNLARRVASLDHLSGGRAGLLLGPRSRYAPSGPHGETAWGGAGLTPGRPLDTSTALDAARAVKALWRSWPAETIVADRGSGIYARAEGIVRIAHRGAFEIDGPLTVPATPQGAPVLAWWADRPERAVAALSTAELLVIPVGIFADVVDQIDAATPLWVKLSAGANSAVTIARIEAATRAGNVAGVVLQVGVTGEQLEAAVLELLPALVAAGLVEHPSGSTLRERLGLRDFDPHVRGAAPAFPSTEPLSRL